MVDINYNSYNFSAGIGVTKPAVSTVIPERVAELGAISHLSVDRVLLIRHHSRAGCKCHISVTDFKCKLICALSSGDHSHKMHVVVFAVAVVSDQVHFYRRCTLCGRKIHDRLVSLDCMGPVKIKFEGDIKE